MRHIQIPDYAEIQSQTDGSLAFRSTYDPALVAALKARIPHSERRWDASQKVWIVAPQHAQALADLATTYLGITPEVPCNTDLGLTSGVQLIKLMYLGAAKDRGGGQVTAYGWANGTWSVAIPLEVLQEWFSVKSRPDEKPTLYAVLGVPQDVKPDDLKRAYRRAARTWHPDVSTDPDATQQFQIIQHAYEILGDPLTRRKYDAGLAFEASTKQQVLDRDRYSSPYAAVHTAKGSNQAQTVWRPPLRCGYVLAEGTQTLGRFVVTKILQWEDIVNDRGQCLVTSWPMGADQFVEAWV